MRELYSRPCPAKCPWFDSEDCVLCTDTERFVRYYIHGPVENNMDEDERMFCVEEADHCGEGLFSTEELSAMSDQDLAKSVLYAWGAYVSSNCI